MRTLGIVTLLGRHPLAGQRIGDASLADRAVDLIGRLCTSVVVATDVDAPKLGLQPDGLYDARIVSLPDGLAALTAELDRADRVVIHDPLCPLVPADFIRRLLDDADPDSVVVAVRPVVDTIKATVGGAVTATVDRDTLRVVSSPIVLAPQMLTSLDDVQTSLTDPVALVLALRSRYDVRLVVAPSSARRAEDESGLRLLSSVDAVRHRIRERG